MSKNNLSWIIYFQNIYLFSQYSIFFFHIWEGFAYILRRGI